MTIFITSNIPYIIVNSLIITHTKTIQDKIFLQNCEFDKLLSVVSLAAGIEFLFAPGVLMLMKKELTQITVFSY